MYGFIKKVICCIIIFSVITAFSPTVLFADSIPISGTVTLVAPAPEDGFEVVVYYGTQSFRAPEIFGGGGSSGAGGSNAYYPIGFSQVGMPSDTVVEVGRNVAVVKSQKITFDKGQTIQSYQFVFDENVSLSNLTIGCYIATHGYEGGASNRGYRYINGYNITANFILDYTPTINIQATVTLPVPADNVGFTITAYNRIPSVDGYTNDYVKSVHRVFADGESECEYSITVIPNREYTFSILFDDGSHKDIYDNMVFVVNETDVSGRNYMAIPSKILSGTVSFPEGFEPFSDSVYVDVHIQSAVFPYRIVDIQSLEIEPYHSSAAFELLDSSVSDVIVYYAMYRLQPSDIIPYGLLGENGTVSSINNALVFSSAYINNVYLQMILPNYLNLEFNNLSSNDSVMLFVITVEDTDTMELGREFKYSGNEILLPDDRENYIIQIYSNKIPIYTLLPNGKYEKDIDDCQYLSDGKFVKDIDDAEIFTVTKGGRTIEITYTGFCPDTPINIDSVLWDDDKSGSVFAYIYNASDFAETDLTAYLCFYDINDRLIQILSAEKFDLSPGEYKTIELYGGDYMPESVGIKLFVWNGDISPRSDVYPIKNRIFVWGRSVVEVK